MKENSISVSARAANVACKKTSNPVRTSNDIATHAVFSGAAPMEINHPVMSRNRRKDNFIRMLKRFPEK